MIKNYIKIAWRSIKRNKLYAAINIAGLSLGICACIVIFLVSSYEFGFDTFHQGVNRIYRVMGDVTENTGDKQHFGRVPFSVSHNSRSEISGIETIAGVIPYNAAISVFNQDKALKHFDSKIGESYFITTAISEPQYFDIFKYQWLAGNASTALNDPLKVVLTESRAYQYFGKISPNELIGKQVIYDDSLNVTVSGIVKDWNENTDLAFTDFISSASLEGNFLKSRFKTIPWTRRNMNAWVFAKATAGVTATQINTQMASLVKKYAEPQFKFALWLQPLTDMHFDAEVIENPIRTADRATLYTLIGIAFFILILAVINFINLSTAQSIHRAKEVGVRKVLGSSRKSLVFQFLTETTVLSFLSVLLAAAMVKPVLTLFHAFIPGDINFNFFKPSVFIFLVLVTLITALLSGLYPAKILSSYRPVLTLKGFGEQRGGEKWLLRKGLIVFQFTASLIFIIGSIVIAGQLKYTREKNPGFNAAAIINIDTPRGDSLSKVAVLAQQVKQLAGVNKVALQWVPPMTGNGRGRAIKFNRMDIKETGVVQVAGNEDFIPLYQIKLLAGRNLVHADSLKEIIINENLSHIMGCKNPAAAIGKTIFWDDKPYPVVGVVENFHTRSFHETIAPLCIVNRPDREATLAIKLAPSQAGSGALQKILLQIEQLWKKTYPAGNFKYQFYDESLALLYEKDQQAATLVNSAMAVTIFISCIGLFGLALYTVQKRSKEISIRKILGAGISNIALMLSKDFVALLLIALLIASPIAWYFMNQWLDGFAYRISIGWWVFVLSGLAGISIVLVTVGYQAIRAAIANPVKSLRTE